MHQAELHVLGFRDTDLHTSVFADDGEAAKGTASSHPSGVFCCDWGFLMSHQQIKSAAIVTADEEFLEVTAGMPATEAVEFRFAYWFSLDRFPGQSLAEFLPVWKSWQEKKVRQTA